MLSTSESISSINFSDKTTIKGNSITYGSSEISPNENADGCAIYSINKKVA